MGAAAVATAAAVPTVQHAISSTDGAVRTHNTSNSHLSSAHRATKKTKLRTWYGAELMGGNYAVIRLSYRLVWDGRCYLPGYSRGGYG